MPMQQKSHSFSFLHSSKAVSPKRDSMSVLLAGSVSPLSSHNCQTPQKRFTVGVRVCACVSVPTASEAKKSQLKEKIGRLTRVQWTKARKKCCIFRLFHHKRCPCLRISYVASRVKWRSSFPSTFGVAKKGSNKTVLCAMVKACRKRSPV